MAMREFVTAAQRADPDIVDADDTVAFKVDGVEMTAHKPSAAQIALLMADLADSQSRGNQVAGTINFVMAVLEEDDVRELKGRLLDRDDPFGLTEITDIIEWLMEEWTGRPFPSLSGSTSSPPNGGAKSTATARSRVSTRSGSRQTASAT